MSFSVLYSSNILCITPRFDAILSKKSGRSFSRFYFRGIKASAEERASEERREESLGTRLLLVMANFYCLILAAFSPALGIEPTTFGILTYTKS